MKIWIITVRLIRHSSFSFVLFIIQCSIFKIQGVEAVTVSRFNVVEILPMALDPKEYEHLSSKERMIQGYPFLMTDELINERIRAKNILQEFNAIDDSEMDKKSALLKTLFHPDSGENFFVESNFRVDYGYNITMGDNAYFNFDCCILDGCPVKIGKNFLAGPGVHIYTASHPVDYLDRRVWEIGKPITIGDDVWIGGMAVICPGVSIGNGVVVGAGSVVTKDVPDNVVVAGNPAKIIKKIDSDLDDVALKRSNALADPKEYEHLSHRERMTRGYFYDCNTEEILALRARSRELQKTFNATDDNKKRHAMLKQILHPDSAPDVCIRIGIKFDFGFNITIGKNAHCNNDLCILDIAPVVIGDNFMSGPNAQIYTAIHPLDPIKRRGPFCAIPVKIGNDVWIGGKAIICPGVTIGNGVTVGAGSVVTKDVPDHCVVVGIPARIVKRL